MEDREGAHVAHLAAAAAALGSAGSREEVVRALLGTLAPDFCDGCEVVLGGMTGALRRISTGRVDVRAREVAPVPDTAAHPVRAVLRTGRTRIIDIDVPADVALFGPPEDPTSARALGIRQAVLAPMRGRGETVGVLAAGHGPSGRRFGPADIELVTVIARLAALALENLAALERQARVIDRMGRAANVGIALHRAEDRHQIARVLLDTVTAALDARAARVYRRQGDELVLLASHGHSAQDVRRRASVPLDAPDPVADACRTRGLILCADGDEARRRYAATDALVAVPMIAGDHLVGAACWTFDGPRSLRDDELAFVTIVVEQAVAAAVRATSREEREVLAGELRRADIELVTSRARLAALADSDVIGILTGEGPRILEANTAFRALLGLDDDAVQRGLTYLELTPDEWMTATERFVERMREDGRAGPVEMEYRHVSGKRVPVLLGGAMLSRDPNQWIAYVVDVSGQREAERRAADAAIQLEQLLEDQRRTVAILQTSLLPSSLPAIDGFELAAHLWPQGQEASVAGDLYDVFQIAPGRWGLIVGDVAGKGVEAAAVTATARHTARAAALHLHAPDQVLSWVHDALVAAETTRFCTMACALLDTTGPAPTLHVALGGHPAGILARADGRAEPVGLRGTLLGTPLVPRLPCAQYELRLGDLLLLYTDGITDAPSAEAMDVAALESWLVDGRDRPLDELARALREKLQDRRPGGSHDDVAIILLRRRC